MPRKKEPSSHSNSQDGTLALSTSEDQPSRSPPPTSQPTTKKSKKERKEADAEDQSSGSTPSNSQSKTKTKTKKSKKERKPTDTISETTDKFLLGEDKGSGGIDNDLDNLFQSSAFAPVPPSIQTENTSKAPSRTPVVPEPVLDEPQSSIETELNVPQSKTKSTKMSAEARAAIKHARRFARSLVTEETISTKQESLKPTSAGRTTNPTSHLDEPEHDTGHESETSSSGNSSGENLVHETLLDTNLVGSTNRQRTRKKSATNLINETPDERNARTVFVGNVSVECVGNKAMTREFLDHLLNPSSQPEPLAPRSRIESYRFRGLPLATPIVTSEVKPDNHAEKRSKTWRDSQASTGVDAAEKAFLDNPDGGRAGRRGAKTLPDSSLAKLPQVKFLTPNQKRKVGYVTGDLHPDAKCCVAFVVMSSLNTSESGQPETEVTSLSAQQLAKLVSEKSDGTNFMGHVLRCDLAGTRYPGQSGSSEGQVVSVDEQRRTLYIGGLDFTEQEDGIRKAVEARLIDEKDGPPPEGGTWVERVRVVRDKGTALGKGFAYVLLKTQDAVEEMLALEAKTFKVGKRKVRLQKYVVPGKCAALKKLGHEIQTSRGKAEKPDKAGSRATKRPKLDLSRDIPAVYAGPDLSQTLKPLSKAERKTIKSSTPARVERRMLKKQAKLKIKLADQQVDRKIEAVKSRPLKHTINKPTMVSASKKHTRTDKKSKVKKAS